MGLFDQIKIYRKMVRNYNVDHVIIFITENDLENNYVKDLLNNNKKFDETTRFQLSYNLIKAATKLKEFKPCFKHYLKNHVRSKMIEIPAQYWEVAIFLPTENFAKAAKTTVYSLSQREI